MKKIYFLVTSLLLFTVFAANAQPPNNECATAQSLTPGAVCTPTAGTTVSATNSLPGILCNGFTATSPGDVWYSFVATATTHSITLAGGTGFDGVIDLRSGACPGTNFGCADLTLSGEVETLVAAGLTIGTTYLIRVYDFVGTGTFTICVSVPPANELCTGALPINCGQTITGTTVGAAPDAVGTCVTALGTAPGVWYTFVGDGQTVTLSLCVGTTYDSKIGVFSGSCGALVCVTGDDDFCSSASQVTFPTVSGTNYFVLVTGFSTNSGSFTLTRTCVPAVDPCTAITPIAACATPVTTVHSGAGTWSPGSCGFTTPGQERVYSFTAATTGFYNLQVTGVAISGFLDYFWKLASGGCSNTGWTCIDDISGAGTFPIGAFTAGTQILILVDDESAAATTHTFQINCGIPPPANDVCTGAININCAQTITGNTSPGVSGATIDLTAPTCGTAMNTAPGLWYTLVGNGTPNILSLCGSAYNTKIAVYTGTCAALTCLAGNDDFCGTQSQVTFNTTLGTTYFILVTGSGTASGAFTLTRTCACIGVPSPGSITGPAATQCRNAPVTLNLTGFPTGVSGITYQWNSAPAAVGPYTPISGATGTSYAFNATTTTYYTVTVTCNTTPGGGSATTAPFQLNVDALAHTAVSATPSTVCQGGSTVITATAINGITTGAIGVLGSASPNAAIPDNSPTGLSSTITIPATTIPNPASMRVRINISHTWVGDLAISLTSPCGTTFLFDRPGTTGVGAGNLDNLGTTNAGSNPPPAVYTFDVLAGGVIPEVSGASGFIASGSYIPSDAAGAPNPTWSAIAFPCSAAGDWTLKVVDNAGFDFGTLVDWQLLGPVPANYTHTLTGPGTIAQNPSTGPNNATGNFTVSNLPAGNHTYVITSTDPFGCSVSSNVPVTVNPTPVVVFSPASATICNGDIQRIDVYATPGLPQTVNSGCSIAIPGTGTVGNGSPYPCVMNVAGLPPLGVTVKSVTINNFDHTFPDDVDLVLVSPTGVSVILMSDAGGSVLATGQIFTFQDGSPALADAAFNPTGTYRPTNYGVPDNFPAPGPGSLSQATPLLSSFTGNANGNWSLYAVDDLTTNAGFIGSWSITFNIPTPVVLTQAPASPNTIFTDAAASTAYVPGTPVYTVWVKPLVTTTYTGTATSLGCPSGTPPATMTVTVNQPPTITTQPTPATQTVCPGFTVTYTVAATGTGPLTYQWRRNGVNLVNGGFISGATSQTLTIANVQAANAGTYDVVVTGICAPAATSNPVVLNVGSAPTITTQPTNQTVCEGNNATFSVVAGGTPTPTIYQWQVDPNTGFTNLTTGGAFSPTLTVPNVTPAMNGFKYRVIITNSCGMTITSNVVTLTVNPRPVVTATPLPTRICLSDTLIPLVGSPAGGTWSGVGVSGSNFVPGSTSVGTYTLTYTFSSAAGCANTATVVARVEDCPERIRLLSNDAVILYPNPNNGKFSIRINSTLYNVLGMKVYDMTGRLMNGKVVKNGTDQALVSPVFTGLAYGRVVPIDLSYLPAGMYLVKFYYDDGVRSSEKGFLVSIIK